MRGFFVIGTDTEVGKTWFTGRLCRELRKRGLDTGVWKPVQSGCTYGGASDSGRLKALSGVKDPEQEICSFTFNQPLAPMIAARLNNTELSVDGLLESGRVLLDRYEFVLVEGAGGWLVPLAPGVLLPDLAVRLQLPVLIVARHGLGTVNHTLLTVEAVRSRGLTVAGVILNGYDQPPQRLADWNAVKPGLIMPESSPANPLMIEAFSQVPVIGMIPKMPEDQDEHFDEHINMEYIVQNLKQCE